MTQQYFETTETQSFPSSPASVQTSQSIPAVVVGANANGLGVIRSLAAGKVPVVVVDDDPRRPGMHSRYASAFTVGNTSGPALIQGLLALRAELQENPVLFLTYDYHVHTVSKYRDQLKDSYRLRLPDHELLCQLLHKSDFQALAEQKGFLVPRAISVQTEQDIQNLRDMRFPAIIKPGNKDLFFNNKAPRAERVFSRTEAEAACRDILPDAPDLIVQEWIDGAESDIYFCLQYRGKNGETIRSFTGRKLRCWPPLTGNTLSCVAAPEASAMLEPLTTAFFDAVGFVGMGSMEFKRDRSSGKFFMIEPTVGRTDWQEEIATVCGVNIPLTAYCYEVGLPLPANQPTGPIIWRAPTCYWRSILATRSFGDGGPAGAKVKRAAWRVDDPVPLFFYWGEWLRRAPKGLRRRFGQAPEGSTGPAIEAIGRQSLALTATPEHGPGE